VITTVSLRRITLGEVAAARQQVMVAGGQALLSGRSTELGGFTLTGAEWGDVALILDEVLGAREVEPTEISEPVLQAVLVAGRGRRAGSTRRHGRGAVMGHGQTDGGRHRVSGPGTGRHRRGTGQRRRTRVWCAAAAVCLGLYAAAPVSAPPPAGAAGVAGGFGVQPAVRQALLPAAGRCPVPQHGRQAVQAQARCPAPPPRRAPERPRQPVPVCPRS
jgi:hypothetical protein